MMKRNKIINNLDFKNLLAILNKMNKKKLK